MRHSAAGPSSKSSSPSQQRFAPTGSPTTKLRTPGSPAVDEFKDAGVKEGIEVWRIEKLKPAPVEKSQYGKFYTGDSYIVLSAFKNSEGQRKYDVHFWLGTETSQDEAGVAALKTIELDDKLGGIPVQHREVQHHESNLFLSYFKGGVQYLEGGIESGFKHVDTTHKKRLLHLKGKRNVRVKEVPISVASLNKGDVFVLDAGLILYQFNGPDASKMEKAKGLEVTSNINSNERGAKATIHIIEYPKDNDRPETKKFWEELGGEGEVAPAAAGGDDSAFEQAVASAVQLLRVSDSSGELVVTPIASVPLKKTQLDTNDCFIVDVGTQIFVWVGKGSTQQEKTSSMQFATGFLTNSGRPEWTPITRVVEGGEPPAFKSQFSNWSDVTINRPRLEKKSTTPSQSKIDVGVMHMGSQRNIDASSVKTIKHKGGGELHVWRVENFKLAELPKDQYGLFYAGDSYVVQYSEKRQGGADLHFIYFWQGRTSSTDEKGASALLARELDDKLNGTATQIRVVQNKEPNHFVSLFDGKLIIKQGGHPSGFNTVAQETTPTSNSPVQLYQIRGATETTTRAVEVPATSASLSSRDAFVLIQQEGVTVWFGSGCNEEEKKQAKQVAARLAAGKTIKEVTESAEGSGFWEALGGKGEYEAAAPHDMAKAPRLFWGSNATGLFKVEEIFDYTQDDLDEDDVYILDLFNELYVWVGSGANDVEKKMAMETAIDFVTHAPDGRSPDTPIYRINAGAEPHMFTQNFVAWDATERDVYKRKMRQLQLTKLGDGAKTPVEVRRELQSMGPEKSTYTFAELSAKEKPKGVDTNALEKYLSEEEFQKVLGVTRAQFEAFPGWKKLDVKKKKQLF